MLRLRGEKSALEGGARPQGRIPLIWGRNDCGPAGKGKKLQAQGTRKGRKHFCR